MAVIVISIATSSIPASSPTRTDTTILPGRSGKFFDFGRFLGVPSKKPTKVVALVQSKPYPWRKKSTIKEDKGGTCITSMNVQQCSAMKREAVKLMAQFQVVIPGRPGVVASVRRGMTVHCSEGRQVANVAAVAVGLQNEQVFCLILGYLPQKELYQSVPISWIDRVEGESVILNVCFDQIQELPEWYPV